MQIRSMVAIAAASALLSACSYDCGLLKSTVANGTARDAQGAALATVQASVSEYLRPSFLRLSVGVIGSSGSAGAPLKGHVTRARLVTESGELLGEIPTGTSTLASDVIVALNVDLSADSEYDRVRNALHTGRAKVILDTDLPGLEHIETILSDAHDVSSSIQQCSPA